MLITSVIMIITLIILMITMIPVISQRKSMVKTIMSTKRKKTIVLKFVIWHDDIQVAIVKITIIMRIGMVMRIIMIMLE